MTADNNQSRPMIVSGSIHSVASVSPPTRRHSPVHLNNPVLRSVDESNAEVSAQDSSPMLDEPCIKVCLLQGAGLQDKKETDVPACLKVKIRATEHTYTNQITHLALSHLTDQTGLNFNVLLAI